jgi:prophage regulatory protein
VLIFAAQNDGAAMNTPPSLISLRETCAITSLSRTAINVRRREGKFPQAVSLGDRRVAFVRAEVISWIEQRIAERGASKEAA